MNHDALWHHYQTDDPSVFRHSEVRLGPLARMNRRGDRVLNIGVGGGVFEACALRLGIDVHTLDPDTDAIIALRQRLGLGDKAQAGRCEAIPFADGLFDAVVMSEVLEHLDDATLERTRAEVRRVLKPAGRFIITVPARERLDEQMVVCPHCRHRHHRWGHVQSFDTQRLRTWLERDFTVVSLIERPFIAWATLNWKGRILAALKLAAHAVGVHGRDECLVAVARKEA